MRFLKAIDPRDATGTIHAAASGRTTRTLCRLSTTSFTLCNEDWEIGSQRRSCPLCVDRAVSFHREWSVTRRLA